MLGLLCWSLAHEVGGLAVHHPYPGTLRQSPGTEYFGGEEEKRTTQIRQAYGDQIQTVQTSVTAQMMCGLF